MNLNNNKNIKEEEDEETLIINGARSQSLWKSNLSKKCQRY